jgi:hypothetical protein
MSIFIVMFIWIGLRDKWPGVGTTIAEFESGVGVPNLSSMFSLAGESLEAEKTVI